MKKTYDILTEDEHIVAINKSAGLLSIPDRFDKDIANALDLLKLNRPDLRVVHRLDRGTSGVLLFAKTEAAHKNLQEQFRNRDVTKLYTAICRGHLDLESGKIETNISESAVRGRYQVSSHGKKSTTYFRVKESNSDYYLLELKLETGRTHQIRVHLDYIHCPLLVDSKYGGSNAFYISQIKRKYNRSKNNDEQEKPILNRTPLHASQLDFRHPITDSAIVLQAPLPKDMKATWNQISKWVKKSTYL